ncbi:MAG TPA: DUF1499 domain-containing protein [Solimonas sp.]|nr:DUF1499 domain-containing protein [Solimonas sp.]
MFKFSGKRPKTLGVRDGKLAPGPAKPNWVSSQPGTAAAHHVAPLQFRGPREQALAAVLEVLRGQPNARVITKNEDYVHAEFESKLMGYVDDVEFYLPPGENAVHVRSASRLGYSDLGVNRARVDMLRAALDARTAPG